MKAFVEPTLPRFGQKFANKSEETRYLKKYDPLFKLRHILLTDSELARNYTYEVLQQYFSDEEISTFSDLGVLNF